MRTRAILLAAALAVGCAQVQERAAPAPEERVVLLPDAQGRAGALVLKTEKGETELSTPYAEAEVKEGTVTHSTSSAEQVRQRYGKLLQAQPPRPRSYVLHFFFDDTRLTPRSRALLERIKAQLAENPAAEIVIIGHTDRVGTEEFNDSLSLRRAEAVRDAFVAIGVPLRSIEVAGRGEREPAVPTADEVPEPRNRRAEIKIR